MKSSQKETLLDKARISTLMSHHHGLKKIENLYLNLNLKLEENSRAHPVTWTISKDVRRKEQKNTLLQKTKLCPMESSKAKPVTWKILMDSKAKEQRDTLYPRMKPYQKADSKEDQTI